MIDIYHHYLDGWDSVFDIKVKNGHNLIGAIKFDNSGRKCFCFTFKPSFSFTRCKTSKLFYIFVDTWIIVPCPFFFNSLLILWYLLIHSAVQHTIFQSLWVHIRMKKFVLSVSFYDSSHKIQVISKTYNVPYFITDLKQ